MFMISTLALDFVRAAAVGRAPRVETKEVDSEFLEERTVKMECSVLGGEEAQAPMGRGGLGDDRWGRGRGLEIDDFTSFF